MRLAVVGATGAVGTVMRDLLRKRAFPADEIVLFAKDRVARFAVPKATQFLAELPRNPTGKVMKRELPPFE